MVPTTEYRASHGSRRSNMAVSISAWSSTVSPWMPSGGTGYQPPLTPLLISHTQPFTSTTQWE